ncbi:MAG: hypothetical protein K2G63_00130 [Oscillospiraceae bacterium]|nr:hypothetical protein [Oscillospiraceae bacterium]
MDKIEKFAENHEKSTILYIVVAFYFGLMLGALMSVAKNGISVFSHNKIMDNGRSNTIMDNGRSNTAFSSTNRFPKYLKK